MMDASDLIEKVVGLARSEATSLIDNANCRWRIGSENGKEVVLTSDWVENRLTLDLVDDKVVSAVIG
jgi:hypothetical protein